MRKSRLLGAVCAYFILCLFNPANASLIDFETVPGGTPSDKLAISTQYLATDGVTFSLNGGGTPFLEKTGGSDTGDGFQYDGAADVEATGHEGELGSYFLRLGTISLLSAPVPDLIITYSSPVSAASAQIWDIDGNDFGTEQWKITAHDISNGVIDTLFSPVGTGS